MSIRNNFEKVFGKNEAQRVWDSAISHGNSINDINKGSDPFKWALLICIGYQCLEKKDYRKHHSIVASWVRLKQWIKKHGGLNTHDGDCDYLSLMTGVYNEYMPQKTRKSKKA